MPVHRRVASVDVGTNTVLLLIAEGAHESPVAVLERAAITRLGQGVDRTGRLAPDAVERTVSCLSDYGRLARESGVDSIDAVCTSAARDAENGGEFLSLAASALGAMPRIIDGDEEARLTIDGAITGLDLNGDVLAFDVGGGSTEIIFGNAVASTATVRGAMSLDIGSVRLTERHVRSDPPSRAELDRVRADITAALSTAGPLLALLRARDGGGASSEANALDAPADRVLVGVAGTVTTLSSIHQGLSVYDSARVHGSRLSKQAISDIAGRLSALTLDARRGTTGLEPGRADVIVAGTEIVRAIIDWSQSETLVVSDRGVRWGLARAALRR